MKTSINVSSLPPSVMMWTINDEVIENPQFLEQQFHDIRSAGFSGVGAFVRCSRCTWDDVESRVALKRIGELCSQFHIHCWIGLDPRFISRLLIRGSKGLHVLVFGDKPCAEQVPNTTPIINNKFNIRCNIEPRPVHTLNEVAVEYHPIGIYRVFAFRMREILRLGSPPVYIAQDDKSKKTIIDITRQSHFFYNAREHYVEAFGNFTPPDNDDWCAIAFFLFETNYFDYSNPKQIERYIEKVKQLYHEGIHFDGLMWDEPGYTCMFGTLPFSLNIQKLFKDETGSSLQKEIWKYALESTDESHIAIRNNYYRIIQSTVNEAQERSNNAVRKFVHHPIMFGIHDTWRWESADMCDMNHGSLDLWRASKSKSGGFVDLGSVNLLKETDSSFYANLATMSIVGASLGRHATNPFVYNNLWTMDDDSENRQILVMDHCINVMALFGIRWLAHCYGPAGIIGQEHSFLGLPPSPGYPHHSTWSKMQIWNERLQNHFEVVQHKLPDVNILLIYPVESLYALADSRANEAATGIFNLILQLTDAHYQVDVVSSHVLSNAKVINGQLHLNNSKYDALIYPYPNVVDSKIISLLNKMNANSVLLFDSIHRTTEGKQISFQNISILETAKEVLDWLEERQQTERIIAPDKSWMTVTQIKSGWIITLAPSRYDYTFRGDVIFNGKTFSLGKQDGLVRIFFPGKGEIHLLD